MNASNHSYIVDWKHKSFLKNGRFIIRILSSVSTGNFFTVDQLAVDSPRSWLSSILRRLRFVAKPALIFGSYILIVFRFTHTILKGICTPGPQLRRLDDTTTTV